MRKARARKGARFRRQQARLAALGKGAHVSGSIVRLLCRCLLYGSLIAIAAAFLLPFAGLLLMALLSRFAKS